ncbi:nuclear transport factor 2 family protein [Aurantiacibacter hainanensis]|uniref:nuclear transport factor 2 family protein n=1 Tax=Aurantiacibacter hainanensis TaxID=3076114 RepID=UPI0030C73CBF
MSDVKDLGERLYKALGSGDIDTLMNMMHSEFRGDLTPGLPLGLGGIFDGREAMMRDCWGVIGENFDMHSDVESLSATEDSIVAFGVYRGTARETGKPIAARFAHTWPVRDGKLMGVHQTTDSAAWHEALTA